MALRLPARRVGTPPGTNAQAAPTGTRRNQPVRRTVLANPDVRGLGWLQSALRASDVDIMVAENGVELERALLDSGPFDLVVASAWIVGPTGLQVLAKARVRHIRTPFVIVTSLSGDAVRIMVSDGGRAAVSSRVVDPESFVALALGLLRPRNVQRLGGGRRTSAPARRPNDPAPGPEIDLGVPSTYRRCHGRRSESGD